MTRRQPSATIAGSRRSAAERRTEIASAAERLARESGLAAITLRAVAEQVGVAPALVAHHAPGMDEVVAHASDRVVRVELDEIRELAHRDASARERLRTILETLLDGSRDDVTLVWVQAWGLGAKNPALAQAVRGRMDEWHTTLTDLLAEGVAAGEFDVDDPRILARQLLGMLDGLNAHALVAWGDAAEQAAALHGAVDVMLRLPSAGLAG